MKGIDAYEVLQNIPDDMVEEARLPQDGGTAVVNPKRERRETVRRFFSSPAFAVAVSLAVAFVVVIAIVRAGAPGGGPTVDPHPSGSVSETARETDIGTVTEPPETYAETVTEQSGTDAETDSETVTEAETVPLTFSFEIQNPTCKYFKSKYTSWQIWTFGLTVRTICLTGQYEDKLRYNMSNSSEIMLNRDSIPKDPDDSGDNGPGGHVELILPNGKTIRMAAEMISNDKKPYDPIKYRAGQSMSVNWSCEVISTDESDTNTLSGWDFTCEGPYTVRVYLMGQEEIFENVYFRPQE